MIIFLAVVLGVLAVRALRGASAKINQIVVEEAPRRDYDIVDHDIVEEFEASPSI